MRSLAFASLALSLAVVSAARAEIVDFTGVVGNACAIAVNNAGTLDTSGDDQTPGAEESAAAGAAAADIDIDVDIDIDIGPFGSNTLTVGAPSVISSPAARDNTS